MTTSLRIPVQYIDITVGDKILLKDGDVEEITGFTTVNFFDEDNRPHPTTVVLVKTDTHTSVYVRTDAIVGKVN